MISRCWFNIITYISNKALIERIKVNDDRVDIDNRVRIRLLILDCQLLLSLNIIL